MISYTIRHATEADIDAIFSIETEASALWKKSYFIQEIINSFSVFIIAENDNTILGFAVAWNVTGEIQLNNIGILKAYRKMGIGKGLILYIVNLLKPQGAEKIFLEVNEHNNGAISFYNHIGFKQTGVRKKYYTSADAILMQMDI